MTKVVPIVVLFCIVIATQAMANGGPASSETNSREIFGLDVGSGIGASFLEQSTNNADFEPGFIVGPAVKFGFPVTRLFRLGIATGYLFYANERVKGTSSLEVSTRYNRFDWTVNGELTLRAFVLGFDVGAGLMVFATKSEYVTGQVNDFRRRVGATGGFLAGITAGFEIGEALMGTERKIMLGVRSDWFRRGRRDEFTALFVLSFEILSVYKKD